MDKEGFVALAEQAESTEALKERLEKELKKMGGHIVRLAAQWHTTFREAFSDIIMDRHFPEGEKAAEGDADLVLVYRATEEDKASPIYRLKTCFFDIAFRCLTEHEEAFLLQRAEEQGLTLPKRDISNQERQVLRLLLSKAGRDNSSAEEILKEPTPAELIDRTKRKLIHLLSEGKISLD